MCRQPQFSFVTTAVASVRSPLSPLAPVLGSEVQTLGVDPKEPLEHSSFVSIHDVLGQREDILTLDGRRGPEGVSPRGACTLQPYTHLSPLACLPTL